MNRLEKFLNQFSSANTIRVYKLALRGFFQTVYPELSLEEAAEKYFSDKRKVEQDLDNFFVQIKNRPPKTVRVFLSAVRSFLIENEVELPERYWRKLRSRKKGTRALTMDRVPSNAELKKIISNMPIPGRALYLTLASSGMRIGEALKMRLNDIDLSKEVGRINIRAQNTKSGNRRTAFISSEAKEAIQEWLNGREQYLQTASEKSRHDKSIEDDRLFPFEVTTAYLMWKNGLRKSGFIERDNSTNRFTMHPHVLRKFFRTNLGRHIPVDVVEALMGHEGYLTEVYRKYPSDEDLAEEYKKGETALLIFSNGREVSKLRTETEGIKESMDRLRARNIDLEDKVKHLEELIESITKQQLRHGQKDLLDKWKSDPIGYEKWREQWMKEDPNARPLTYEELVIEVKTYIGTDELTDEGIDLLEQTEKGRELIAQKKYRKSKPIDPKKPLIG